MMVHNAPITIDCYYMFRLSVGLLHSSVRPVVPCVVKQAKRHAVVPAPMVSCCIVNFLSSLRDCWIENSVLLSSQYKRSTAIYCRSRHHLSVS